MKYFTLICIIALGYGSCKKESIGNFCHDTTLISHITRGDLSIQELTYNGNCQIYESIERFSYKKYSYNAQNQLLKLERAILIDPFSCYMAPGSTGETYTDPRKAKITEYSEFEYDSVGRLARKVNYFINNGNNLLVSSQSYDYENSQLHQLKIFTPQGLLSQYHDYQYDGNGNLVVDDYYLLEMDEGAKLQSKTICEFDDKYNPYYVFAGEGEPGLFTNRNNILKQTITVYNTGEYQNSIQNTFEYNPSGYPVKANDLEYSYNQ